MAKIVEYYRRSAEIPTIKAVGAELGVSVDVLARDGEKFSDNTLHSPQEGNAVVTIHSGRRIAHKLIREVNRKARLSY